MNNVIYKIASSDNIDFRCFAPVYFEEIEEVVNKQFLYEVIDEIHRPDCKKYGDFVLASIYNS